MELKPMIGRSCTPTATWEVFIQSTQKTDDSLQNHAVVNLLSAGVPLFGYGCKDLKSVLSSFTRLAIVIS